MQPLRHHSESLDYTDKPPFITPDWRNVADRAHCVQFYHSDEFLVDSVGAFVAAGLDRGEPNLVIATPEHRRALERRLLGNGSDIFSARVNGKLFMLDAAETLQKFMLNGAPDRALFQETLDPIFAELGDTHIRAFGEMVALLWAEGNQKGALQLEGLWNDFAATHRFALLCAYPLRAFGDSRQTEGFAHVCDHHAIVIPAESYPAGSDDARRREISFLQQKAAALEAEVAERKIAERALDERKATLTMATALAGLGIWELDLSQRSLNCCDRSKQILGWSAPAKTDLDLLFATLHEDDYAAARFAIEGAIDSAMELNVEARVQTDSGPRWIALQGQRVDGDDSHLLGVILDITARKNAAATLENIVAERTARLRETIADLEAFSYSISHDMRSPLRAIHGYADILMQECRLEAQHAGYLTRIGAAAQRMDRLIEDVLAFSRVARTDLALVPVEAASLFPAILESSPTLQAPQAQINIDGALPRVFGNHAMLTQCFSNLLNNAVKFVSPGVIPKIRVWSDANIDQGGRPRVRINVSDNGIGIECDMQEKIFAIFQRLSAEYEGTGIGLAIVKKAVERMGGRVGLISQPGHGSTFWIELKAAL